MTKKKTEIISKSLVSKYGVRGAELFNSIEEGFANLSSSITVPKPTFDRLYQEWKEFQQIIYERTRPPTLWERVKWLVIGAIIGYLISMVGAIIHKIILGF